jgi:hypothetical protein
MTNITVTQINKDMLVNLITIVNVWAVLGLIALILVMFRTDALAVGEDMDSYFAKKSIMRKFTTAILMYVILPLSIPYSINNIISKRK